VNEELTGLLNDAAAGPDGADDSKKNKVQAVNDSGAEL